jgi:uncharacterized membrane protein
VFTKATSQSLSVDGRLRVSLPDPLVAMTAGAVLLGFAIRTTVGADAPLWLDETFTGAIAAQPSLRSVVHQILQDANAPIYCLLAHAWSLLFALSNRSLRFPALVFGSIAPLLCLIPTPGIARRTRLLWCSLIALWIPGFLYSQEARCYSLLLCLAIGSTIAFVRLIDEPNSKRASIWALLGSLSILTHYYALILIAFQGLAYVGLHQGRALRSWPAALVFLPVFAWLIVHSGRIAEFADPHIAWYSRMDPMQLLYALIFVAGRLDIALAIPLIVGLAVLFAVVCKPEAIKPEDTSQRSAWIAAATAVAGAAAIIALAFWRPSFTVRYLIPFIPGLFLGLGLMFEPLRRYWILSPLALILIFTVAAIAWVREDRSHAKIYNFQTASDALIAAGTQNLVFLWDHPANPVEDPSQLAIVGGFFFNRQGIDVHVTPLKLATHEDPNTRLIALADQPHSAILWIYDTNVHDTAARTYPPRITKLASAWRCHDFGSPPIGILACTRKDAT